MLRLLFLSLLCATVYLGLQLVYAHPPAAPGIPGRWGLGDRVFYGLVFVGLGGILFWRILPWAWPGRDREPAFPPLFRDKAKKWTASFIGLGAGMAYTVVPYLVVRYSESSVEAAVHLEMARELRSSHLDLAMHLLVTGGLTGLLEELFYRGAVFHFLERYRVPMAWSLVWSTLLFTIGHFHHTWPVIIGAGLLFGFLFWRLGLLPAILAHVCYNATLLLITAYDAA